MNKITKLITCSILFVFISLLLTGCGMSEEEKRIELSNKLDEIEIHTKDITQTAQLYELVMTSLLKPNANWAELKDNLDGLNNASYKTVGKFEDVKIPKGLNNDKEKLFKEMRKQYADSCSTLSLLSAETAKTLENGKFTKYEIDNLVKLKKDYEATLNNATSIYNELKKDI